MSLATSIWLDRVPDAKRYPVLSGTIETDVVVVGGGIVGVMTARNLLEKGFRVVLLEKNHIATGDTGATTGFLTRVPDASFAALQEKYGAPFVAKIFEVTSATQRRVFDLIKNEKIDCEFRECNAYYGSYEAQDAVLEKEWGAVAGANANVTRVTKGTFVTTKVPFVEAVQFANEGAFNVRKFLFAVLDRFDKQKFQAFEESEAIVVDVGDGVIVKTEGGIVRAKRIVCTTGRPIDAFSELQSLVDLKLTYVIAARYEKSPLSDDLFWDTGDPYFYYRNAGAQTVIVGGADIESEKVGTQKPYEKLEQFLRDHIAGDHTITHQWSGSIFHTVDGLPYAFAHPQYRGKVFVGTGFGGNGMVMGMMTAEALAELVAGQVSEKTKMFGLERTGEQVSARMPLVATRGILAEQWVAVADVADFAKKQSIAKKVSGKTVAVFKVAGEYFAIHNVCTHAGGSLADGDLEGKVIQCPLHGAKFDVTTGEVLAAPAIRRVAKYPLRVTGTTIEVQIGAIGNTEDRPLSSGGPSSPPRHWKSLALFSIGATLFWLAEFAFQYAHLIPGELKGSLVRSFALAGATFFGFALFSSALFKWIPKWAQYWRYRRYCGVAGFVFIFGHVWSVFHFFFNYDVASIYYSLNPIDNPLVFGSIAFPIFFIMAATSTDWAVQKLTPKVWKRLHRLVYIAYWASVFHFVLINPQLLRNVAGYLLLVVTGLALFGQFYWFVRTVLKRPKPLAIIVGLAIIALYIVTASVAYQKKVVALRPKAPPQEEAIDVSVQKMKDFMQKFPVDPDIATTPIVADKFFVAPLMRKGVFQNLNYMTSGTATLQQKDGQSFVVFEKDFETPNGPDLVVYLTKNTGPTERSDIRAGVQLGKLKSIKGKQVYVVPADTDVAAFNSVSIHCRAFNVPWSYAPLQ